MWKYQPMIYYFLLASPASGKIYFDREKIFNLAFKIPLV